MSDRTSFEIIAGQPDPLGATVTADGANFAIYSENAERIELCLFDATGATELQRLELPARHGDIRHGFVPRARTGLLYGYRVHGRYDQGAGHLFNPNKLLIDPYARALSGPFVHHATQFGFQPGQPGGELPFDTRDSAPHMPKCRLVAPGPAGDTGSPPRTPWRDTVIYELHVKGFSRLHPDVAPAIRGSYAALGSDAAIRHFKSLGITAIELLPVAAFNDEPHIVAKGLSNYWGYNPFCLMAPEPRYGIGDARAELAGAVRKLHDAGLEVILDVVFNHTGEGWHLGPTLSLKGIDNAAYYRLEPNDRSRYVDHGGCGNTLDLSRPHVRRLMLDSLRTWVEDYGIDGFRFDLASTLGREADGRYSPEAETFAAITADPVLARVKLIAEPWDCGPDGYQLGGFPSPWVEWNDRSRDAIRRFWRGDDGQVPQLARRLAGSADEFGPRRAPLASVNFVTAHDGMRLADLVSYDTKRNAANSEDNRDGAGEDWSCAYGSEGPTQDSVVQSIRSRQMRNLAATLLLSQGVPMLAAGDEIGCSQGGNNNPYCQDNEVTWIDWKSAGPDGLALLDFTRAMLAVRRRYPSLRSEFRLAPSDAIWLSPEGREMSAHDWDLPWARCFGLMLAPRDDGPSEHLLVLFNAHSDAVDFRLPEAAGSGLWSLLIDTTESEGFDPAAGGHSFRLAPRSLAVLAAPALRGISDVATSALDQLAEAAGISPSYHDLAGVTHITAPETKRVLLSAMGFTVGDRDAETQAIRQLRHAAWASLLPSVIVMRIGAASQNIAVTVGSRHLPGTVRWTLHLEGGDVRSGEARSRDLAIVDLCRINGLDRQRLALPLESYLRPGYHRLAIEIAGERGETCQTGECPLIAAPDTFYRPDWLGQGRRIWGVAHQLYSLRDAPDKGIGDFSALGELAETIAAQGGACVGVNPLHALSLAKPDDASPYCPSSRLFLNPLYIDVTAVPEARGLDLRPAPARPSALVDYAAVQANKFAVLAHLFERFERGACGEERAAAFDVFLAEGGDPLQRFALHQTLEEDLGHPSSSAWHRRFRSSTAADTVAFATAHARRVRFHAWLQFEADRQLRASGCERLELGLYGDLAVGVDPMGADVWADPGAFTSKVRIGAPPDQFSPDGQEWGLLPFDPNELRRRAYRPFVDMIRAAMRYCGAIRIDHVMWLERMFWVPEGGKPADGAYVRFPVDDLMAVLALESHRNRCVVVGEDLGTVPLGFRERMEREGMLSYKLMRFERYHDGLYGRPSTYARRALATPASHDLPTIAGHWQGRDIDVRSALGLLDAVAAAAEHETRATERCLVVAALADQGLVPGDFPTHADLAPEHMQELIAAVHAFLARTPSAVLMLNLEDLAASSEQVNLPGPLVGYPCWRIRLEQSARAILEADWVRRMLSKVAEERGTPTV